MLNNAVKNFQDFEAWCAAAGSAFDLIGLAIRKIQQNTVPVLNVFVFLVVGILVKEELIISRPEKTRKILNIPALDKHTIQ